MSLLKSILEAILKWWSGEKPAVTAEPKAVEEAPKPRYDPPVSAPAPDPAKMTDQQRFLLKIMPAAKAVEAETGIKAIIMVTQAAHESNWGRSGLTAKANNLFGFTGEAWAKEGKPVIVLETQEFVKGKWITTKRPFRSYASWEESVRDWARLMHISRYAQARMWAKEGNVGAFAKAVAEAGYATDPKYADKLAALGKSLKEGLA